MDRKISKFKIQDSKKNVLIQLADMVAGSVAKRTSNKPDCDFYYDIIKHRNVEFKYYPNELIQELRKKDK